ncbi:uncharacterized protein TNCV_4568321 [Trichonephila clavipes]|nr:uncharacterized protein TNCV_4568321 [Trichonephila clavipes]
MRICHRWMQEETTDRASRSHPPHCTSARNYRWIVCMAVMDHAATSRTKAQQQTQSHALFGVRSYHSTPFAAEWNVRKASIASFTLYWKHASNGVLNGGYGQRNEMTLCLLSNPTSACNIRMDGLEFGDIVERGR